MENSRVLNSKSTERGADPILDRTRVFLGDRVDADGRAATAIGGDTGVRRVAAEPGVGQPPRRRRSRTLRRSRSRSGSRPYGVAARETATP